jgi:hypothetical protein
LSTFGRARRRFVPVARRQAHGGAKKALKSALWARRAPRGSLTRSGLLPKRIAGEIPLGNDHGFRCDRLLAYGELVRAAEHKLVTIERTDHLAVAEHGRALLIRTKSERLLTATSLIAAVASPFRNAVPARPVVRLHGPKLASPWPRRGVLHAHPSCGQRDRQGQAFEQPSEAAKQEH